MRPRDVGTPLIPMKRHLIKREEATFRQSKKETRMKVSKTRRPAVQRSGMRAKTTKMKAMTLGNQLRR
jgi:hypothetical protein